MSAARRLTRWLPGTLATALAMAAVGALSAFDVSWHAADAAALRLSWNARPERIEVCRALSREEIESRNEHMRQRVECDGSFATYALRVRVDGAAVGQEIVRGGGLRNDRPMHVLETYVLQPGQHRIQLDFSRREQQRGDSGTVAAPDSTSGAAVAADTGLFAGRAGREVAERRRRVSAAVPARLGLDTIVTVASRSVVLVTFDATLRRLTVRADRDTPR